MIKALLLAAAVAVAASASDSQSLIATGKAFADAAAKLGVAPAFRQYAASGGVVFVDGKAVRVSEAFADGRPGPHALAWRAHAVGVARSGDLGFDVGPYTHTAKDSAQTHGWFATVWAKQADGAWRFLAGLDTAGTAGPSPTPQSEPVIVAPGLAAPTSNAFSFRKGDDTSKSFNEVQGYETSLGSVGTRRSLAGDAWVLRNGHEAARGADAAALAGKDPRMFYTPLAGGVSGDGDLAYFYGRAETAKMRAIYLHVWQRRPGGWRIVVDAIRAA